jgi:hypothetical protein
MNQRIYELVKAAGGISHDDDGQELTPMLVGSGLEKFAELIVLECMRLVGNKTCPNYAYKAIENHFGITQ